MSALTLYKDFIFGKKGILPQLSLFPNTH